MSDAQTPVEATLREVVSQFNADGLTSALNALTRDVWTSNVDRFEPEDLGDTPNSLGFQAYQNFTQRALRRFHHDPRESVENHWNIPGLVVTNPRGVLTLSLNGNRVAVLKVPFAHGRKADFGLLSSWENQSDARFKMAARNSHVLGGYRSDVHGQDALWERDATAGTVQDFILAWAGEQQAGLTAAWLGVPVLGEDPFMATLRLWWDPEHQAKLRADLPVTNGITTGPGVPAPRIALKPQRAEEIGS